MAKSVEALLGANNGAVERFNQGGRLDILGIPP
jgi:hypothetical protein